MNCRLTLYWESGFEQSAVYPEDKAFHLAQLAMAEPDLKGFVLESER